MTAERAVLLAPRIGSKLASPEALKAMNVAMEQLTMEGVELVGIMDPADFMTALQMLLDGKIDRVVATRPDHIPGVRFIGDVAWFRPGVAGTANAPAAGQRRTRLVGRLGDVASADSRSGRARRPEWAAPQTPPRATHEPEGEPEGEQPSPDKPTAPRTSRLPARAGETFWRDKASPETQRRTQRVNRA